MPLLRRIAAALATFGLIFSAVFVMPTAAQAAPNPAIVVKNIVLTGAVDGVVTVGDKLTMNGDWDASNAAPKAGDSFTSGLPSQLRFAEGLPFQLIGSDNVVWGTCLTGTDALTCTLSDAVTENPEEVMGTFELEVEAVATTSEEEVSFDLNGVVTVVDLPGKGGIGDGVVLPTEWTKSGVMNSNKWSMTWKIELPGARLSGNDVINIGEALSDNHQLCDPANLKIETVRDGAVVDVLDIGEITPASGAYDFGIKMTAPSDGFDPNVTYRLTYETCTPDGKIDPVDTVYENNATVDVWGESSGIIGVTQDWAFTGQVEKSGSVLGGTNRNSVIQWNVTVAGDHLFGEDGFNFSDTLAGEHELCVNDGDGRVVQGLKITERYGPSRAKIRDVTADMLTRAVDVDPETDATFSVDFSIPADSDFEFRASDYLYVISYRTCASTDGLPEAGTTFTNEANINSVIAGNSAKVPGRYDRKSGNINTSSVELNGVSHLPQTTLGWNITVPGERIADIDSELTMTDTLTDAHQVCSAEGEENLATLLGLKVEARDQISGGGLSPVDITSNTTAELDGDGIVVTIQRPTLPLPGGGEATGFSQEYQYVITYTTCTTSGGMDAPGTTYGNEALVAGKTYTQDVTQKNRASGTGKGVSRGSIAVAKSLANTPGAQFVPAGTVFTVHVKEISPDKEFTHEYDLKVPLDGTPASGLNSRGTGWTVELSELAFPAVPGVTFGAPVFSAVPGVTVSEDGTIATATVTPKSNIEVLLTNSAELGSLEVVKLVEGPAAELVDADQAFSVTAQVDVSALGTGFPIQDNRVFTISQGQGFTLDDLPIGATVSFTETLPADNDTLTWGAAVIDPSSIEVLPGHASEPATITVTNQVDRTVGTFSLVKNVTGDEANNPAVPDDVTVTAKWNEEGTLGEATLTLPTDGTTVAFGKNLLIGTKVTLTETALVDGSSIAWGAPVWSGTGVEIAGETAVVTIGRNADAQVTLQNQAVTSTAGISLLKGIAGEAAGEVDPETEFLVTATWTDAKGDEQSKELLINSVQPISLGEQLPAGTVVTLTEGDSPEFSTVVWDSITITGTDVEDNGDGSARVIVSDQQGDSTLITVRNEATWSPGTFSLTKDVTGVLLEHPDVPDTVTVTATWLDGEQVEQSAELIVPTDGTLVPFGQDLPHATQVTLIETTPENSQSFTWDAPIWGGDNVTAAGEGSAVVTIGAATTAAVSLTNNATVSLGSIELVKELTGTADVPTNTVFPVTASWTDLMGNVQQKDVEVTVGTPTVIDNLPLGVAIQLTENEADLPDRTRWDGVTWATQSDNVTVVGDGAEAVVTVMGEAGSTASISMTNEIAELPDLDSAGDQKPNGDLASTGLDLGPWQLGGIIGVGLSLLVVGAVLLLVRRARRS